MAGITLAQATAQLQKYLDAETAVLAGQSYEIGGRKLTRADLEFIQKGTEIWNQRVITLTNQQNGVSRAVVPTVGW